MEAVQTTHILTIRPSFAAEAGRVSGVAYGQILLLEDDVTIDIRHRHLSRGDEIEVVHRSVVHLPFLVGELTRAVARVFVDDVGRLYLEVTSFTSIVEEEVDECALQASSITLIDGEASTRDLHTQLEVNEVIVLRQLPVGLGGSIKCGHLATSLDADVVLSRSAFGHDVGGEVRYREQDLTDLRFGLGLLLLQALACLLEQCHLRADALSLLLGALLHQITDLLSEGLLTREAGIELLLRATADLIEVQYFGDRFACLELLLAEALNDRLGILLDLLECKHNVSCGV